MVEKVVKEGEAVKYEEIPSSLVALYMQIQSRLIAAYTAKEKHSVLMESIEKGGVLLDKKHNELKFEVKRILNDPSSYPKKKPFKFSSGTYKLSSESSGLIEVRPEEIQQGEATALEQECNRIVPRLKLLNSNILDALVESGTVARKEPMKEFTDRIYHEMEMLIKEEEKKLDK